MEWFSSAFSTTFWASMAGVALVTVFHAVNPNPAKGKGLHWVTKACLGVFAVLLIVTFIL